MPGFRPVQDISGNSYTGKVQTFGVAAAHASLLAVGDLVKETGIADATTGIAEVDAATAGANVTGAIISIAPNFSNLEQAGLPASTGGTVKVAVDPNTLYETTLSGGSVALADVGTNADIVITAATLSGGLAQSNMALDASAFITGTDVLRLVGLKDAEIGANGTVFVRINESTIKSTTGV